MSRDNTRVSVVICTHTLDRWADVCDAVQSVRAQTLRPNKIILVVDHNQELLDRAKAGLPGLLVIPNGEARGLSGARNTGISVSTGSLIAFLDDDAIADPAWLSRLAKCCEAPDVLGATPRIEPLWKCEEPRWLPEEFLWIVGCSYGRLPMIPQEVRNVLGAGMAIKREVFERAGGFDTVLGRQGTSFPLSCEETELCIRARTFFPQCRFMFEPSALVRHKVRRQRLTFAYFSLRCYAEGLSKGYLTTRLKRPGALATERSYVLQVLSRGFVRGIADFVFRLKPDGLKRSAAIVLGLASAGAGFTVGKLYPQFEFVPAKK